MRGVSRKFYSVGVTKAYLQFIEWDVEAIGKLPELALEEQRVGTTVPRVAPKEKRLAYFKELNGSVEIPIYLGSKLAGGNEIEGPAVIEEPLTTIVVLEVP